MPSAWCGARSRLPPPSHSRPSRSRSRCATQRPALPAPQPASRMPPSSPFCCTCTHLKRRWFLATGLPAGGRSTPQHQRAAARAGVGRRGRAGALAAGGGEQISAAPWPGATNCASRMSTAMTKLVCLLLSASPPCGSWRVPPPQLGGARFSAGRRPPWRYPTESSRGLELCCKQEVLTLTMSSRGRAGLHRLLPSLESRPSYRRKVGLWRGV